MLPCQVDARHLHARLVYLHYSGDSDNSGSNGVVHLAIIAAAIVVLTKGEIDSLSDEGVLIIVEGDDSLVLADKLQTPAFAESLRQCSAVMGSSKYVSQP